MANGVFQIMSSCATRERSRDLPKLKRYFQWIQVSTPLQSREIHSQACCREQNPTVRFFTSIRDRYSKLTSTVSMLRLTASNGAAFFLAHWTLLFEIPDFLLTATEHHVVKEKLCNLFAYFPCWRTWWRRGIILIPTNRLRNWPRTLLRAYGSW